MYSWFGMTYLMLVAAVVVYRVHSLVWYGLQLVWYGLPSSDSRRGGVQSVQLVWYGLPGAGSRHGSVQLGLVWLTWCWQQA